MEWCGEQVAKIESLIYVDEKRGCWLLRTVRMGDEIYSATTYEIPRHYFA
jgi:hypothetical protein